MISVGEPTLRCEEGRRRRRRRVAAMPVIISCGGGREAMAYLWYG